MTFKDYLQQKKYSPVTINRYQDYIERFLRWLKAEDIEAAAFTYNDLLAFIGDCNSKGITQRTVHNMLGIIRHYCNYLIKEGKRADNPAAGVFIKGLVKRLPAHLLTMEELEMLYSQYSIQLNVDDSKKIMLGLMIYQGLTAGELIRLEAKHLRLKEGKIFIKGTKRSNERLLNLDASQVVALQAYLNKNKFKEGPLFREKRKTPVSGLNINNRIQHMFGQLRQLNPKVTNPKQIRSSVIMQWLRNNNLRQVQYMAGHKYVSSTQRYQSTNLDDLKSELQEHHPMK